MSHSTSKWMVNDRKRMIMILLYCFSLFHFVSLPIDHTMPHNKQDVLSIPLLPHVILLSRTPLPVLPVSLISGTEHLAHLSFTFAIPKTSSQHTSLLSHSYYTMHRGTIPDIYAQAYTQVECIHKSNWRYASVNDYVKMFIPICIIYMNEKDPV